MDCKKLEEYVNVVVRSEGEKVMVDQFFFLDIIKELIKRRRVLGQRGKRQSVVENRNILK
jgi:hypothetical protein